MPRLIGEAGDLEFAEEFTSCTFHIITHSRSGQRSDCSCSNQPTNVNICLIFMTLFFAASFRIESHKKAIKHQFRCLPHLVQFSKTSGIAALGRQRNHYFTQFSQNPHNLHDIPIGCQPGNPECGLLRPHPQSRRKPSWHEQSYGTSV